jgi:hypothetical protein
LHVDAGSAGRLVVRTIGEFDKGPGEKIQLSPDKSRIHRFDAAGKALRK